MDRSDDKYSALVKRLRAPHTAFGMAGELRALLNQAADAIEFTPSAVVCSDELRVAMTNLLAEIEKIPPKANEFRLFNAYDRVLKAVCARSHVGASEQMPRTFEYLLNAMDRAAMENHPAEHGYGAKRKAVLNYVSKLQSELHTARCDAEVWRTAYEQKAPSCTPSAIGASPGAYRWIKEAAAVLKEADYLAGKSMGLHDRIEALLSGFIQASDWQEIKPEHGEQKKRYQADGLFTYQRGADGKWYRFTLPPLPNSSDSGRVNVAVCPQCGTDRLKAPCPHGFRPDCPMIATSTTARPK